eukprot:1159944-Pelagomonas_calceolata.AAC.2
MKERLCQPTKGRMHWGKCFYTCGGGGGGGDDGGGGGDDGGEAAAAPCRVLGKDDANYCGWCHFSRADGR